MPSRAKKPAPSSPLVSLRPRPGKPARGHAARLATTEALLRALGEAEPLLDLGPGLPLPQRTRLFRLARRQPAEFLEMLCELVEGHDGEVVGMTFDTTRCREALAAARSAELFARAADKLAKRMEERAATDLVGVVDSALALVAAIDRQRHTHRGAALADELAALRAVQKKRKRAPAEGVSGARASRRR